MPTFQDEQQQPTTPVAPPSQSPQDEVSPEVAKVQRQLDSVRGNHEKEQKRANDLEKQLKDLLSKYESERTALSTNNTTLTEQLEAEKKTKAEVEAEAARYKRQLNVMGIANTKYPSLIPLLTGTDEEPPVIVIPDNVKTAEELDAYLNKAQTRLAGVLKLQQPAVDPLSGSAPQPPSGGSTTMTLQEVSDAKIAAHRKFGASSKEFKDLQMLEDQMMRKMFVPS